MRVTNFSFVLCKLFPAEAVKSSPKIGGLVMSSWAGAEAVTKQKRKQRQTQAARGQKL